jgi:adenine deaminase
VTVQIAERIDAAVGNAPADLILESGRIVNVFTKEIAEGSVAIRGDRIVAVGEVPEEARGADTEVRDLGGKFVVPGYVEAHMHVGGSYMHVGALAAALLERGTTSLATDMYEPYCMAGIPGVEESIEAAEQTGLKILYMTPIHLIGIEKLGTFAHPPDVEEYLEMGRWSRTVAVNEAPPFVVLGKDENVLRVIQDALEQGKIFEGHVVGAVGNEVQAYRAAGGSSDHESVSAEEALERLRLGYRILMRDGSVARDLPEIAPLLVQYPDSSRFFMVCTDEVEPKHLISEGHIDHKLRQLVEAGVEPVTALQTATINPAEYLGQGDDLGSITPGKVADVLVLDALEQFRPSLVVASGRVVAEDGRFLGEVPAIPPSAALRSKVVLGRSLEPADFRMTAPKEAGRATVMVIGTATDGNLVSKIETHELEVRDGVVLPDPDRGVLRVAVVDRHKGSGQMGRAFMTGTGLTAGAVSMTYCHVHQNLLVLGTSDEEMAHAAAVIENIGGGIAVVRGGHVLYELELPYGGVLSSGDLEQTAADIDRAEEAIRSLGCPYPSPVLSIAFSCLPTIPAYGLTDLGLYDVAARKFVEPIVEVA